MFKQLSAILVPVLVLLVILSEINSSGFYSDAELKKAREQSVEYARQGDYEQAIERFVALVDIANENQNVWADYLTVLNWAGQHEKAVELATNLELNTAPLYALDALFDSAVKTKDYALALQVAEAGLTVSEQPQSYAIDKASLLIREQLYLEADRLISLALQQQSGNKELLIKQLVVRHKLEPAKVRQDIENLLAKYPDNRELQVLLADVAVYEARQGDYVKALATLSYLVELDSDNAKTVSDYLVVLAWDGQYNKAASLFLQRGASVFEDYALEEAAGALYESGYYAEAEAVYADLAKSDPDKLDYHLALVRARLALNKIDQAREGIQFLLEKHPDDIATLMVAADVYEITGDSDRAFRVYNNLIGSKEQPESYYRRWFHHAEKAILQYGYSGYKQLLWRAFDEHEVLRQLLLADYFALLLRNSDFQKAEIVRPDVVPASDAERITEKVARVARDRRRTEQAIALYRWGIKQYPDNRQLELGLALSFSEAGNYKQADKIFGRLTARKPRSVQVWNAAVYHYRASGNEQELLNSLAQLVDISNGRSDYMNSWLQVLLAGDSTGKTASVSKMLQRYRTNSRLKAELILLLSDADDCQSAVSLMDSLNADKLASGLLEQVAFRARSCLAMSQAKRFYLAGLKSNPDKAVFAAGTLLVYAETKDAVNLQKSIRDYGDKYDEDKEFLEAKGYAYHTMGGYESARETYSQILERWPSDSDAYIQWVMNTNYAGDPENAISRAREKPGLFGVMHWRRLYSDRAALAIRQAGKQRHDKALHEKALAYIDEYLGFIQRELPGEETIRRQAEMDRLVALRNMDRNEEVIENYKALNLTVQETPVYVLREVADAHIALQQPRPAIDLLRTAREKSKDDVDIISRLFYAYLDNEQYDDAQQVLRELLNRFEGVEGGGVHWTKRLEAMFSAYRNDLEKAQQLLEGYLLPEPGNSPTRNDLATIYRWRGWPVKALVQYDKVLQAESGQVEALVGKAYAQLDLWQFDEAHQVASPLIAEHGDERSVQQLQERLAIRHMRELDSRVMVGHSGANGNGSGAMGDDDIVVESRLFDKPYKEHYRPFLHQYYARADFDRFEGDGEISRLGVGVQYRDNGVEINAELSEALNGNNGFGVTLDGSWRIDDHWTIAGNLQTYSLDVPLRAINAEADGKSVTVAAQYRWNEQRRLKASISQVNIDKGEFPSGAKFDSNRRHAFSLIHSHDVYSNEHHKLSLIEQAYYSQNTDAGKVIYYNPESEWLAHVAIQYIGVLHRRYEKKHTHRLTVGLGHYDQEDYSDNISSEHFGSDAVWDVEYEHVWHMSNTLRVNLGLLHRRRTYDGDSEEYDAIYAGVNWRF
jgi:biofilm PGA synthesis protein PgaA